MTGRMKFPNGRRKTRFPITILLFVATCASLAALTDKQQTIPYGRRYNARNIEKLLYTKDLLLNAQWNQPKDRQVYLHRHPAFFGDAEHVLGDCCGFCPQPVTEDERMVAEEERKIYISGNVTFIKDDPGRQEIGSFNPITETDWTGKDLSIAL